MTSRLHPAEVRTQGIRWYTDGVPIAEIALRLNVPYQTVRYWIESTTANEAQATVRKKAGSGVIAPSAYHRGSRWSLGRGEGWA